MKFNIRSRSLLAELSAVGKVILAKSPLSILENFLFTLDGNTLVVKGSDRENVMTTTLEVTDAEGEGSIALPARRMLDMLKEIPDMGISFTSNDTTREVEIRFGQGHFVFMGLDGSEYPQEKERDADSQEVAMAASTLYAGIDNTLYAAAKEPIRPIMTGVCMDFKESGVVFVASDTHKLVKYEVKNLTPGLQRTVVLPPKACSLLKFFLEKEEGDVKIIMDSRGATFECGAHVLTCLFITGNYPPYERVIPKNNPYTLEVDREALAAAMRRMGLSANTGSKLVRCKVSPDLILLSARDVDFSRSADEKVACTYSGPDMQIGFNYEYVVDVLTNLKGETTLVQLSDPSRPAIFLPQQQPEDAELLVLQMTMQLID